MNDTTMSEAGQEVDYKKRHKQHMAEREKNRPEYTKQDYQKMVAVLGDRLALALHVMSDHEQFIVRETTVDQMKYLEDWVEVLLEQEPPAPSPGRPRRFDYWRSVQRYEYLRRGIRTMLREQLKAPPDIPKRGVK